MLIDAHCHLDDRRFDADRADVLARARAAGVTHFITVGCEPGTHAAARALAAAHADVWCTLGIHPHNAGAAGPAELDALEAQFRDPRVVAVGECGLDFYYDLSPRERQREVCAAQVALARRLRKPLVIHVRDAYAELLDLLRAERASDVGGIIHCFTGTWDFARQALDMHFDLSVPGVVTFAKAGELPEVVRRAPRDRLLVETDSPYLAPAPHRGKRNEPAWVRQVAAKVAELWGVSEQEACDQAARNTLRRFSLPAAA